MVFATCRLCGDYKRRKQGGELNVVQYSTEKVEFIHLKKKNPDLKSLHAQNCIYKNIFFYLRKLSRI